MQEDLKQKLLHLARSVVEAEVRSAPLPAVTETDWPALDHAGVFVTLRIGSRLRGCIGTFKPTGSLPATVREMSRSACHDPRFLTSPILETELPHLAVHLSVLSPLERAHDPESLIAGVHGIYIRRGQNVGCFLPQVATEMGWDVQTLLSECCRSKAALPPYAWQDRDTEVFFFTTESFGRA